MDGEIIKWILAQIPSNASGAVIAIAIFMYAVKAQWIPLSVSWKNKKIIAAEEDYKRANYVTREYLMKNCENRQNKLDDTLNRQLDYINEQFKNIFSILQTIDRKITDSSTELTKQISVHDGEIKVLQERTSHHRKDD